MLYPVVFNLPFYLKEHPLWQYQKISVTKDFLGQRLWTPYGDSGERHPDQAFLELQITERYNTLMC